MELNNRVLLTDEDTIKRLLTKIVSEQFAVLADELKDFFNSKKDGQAKERYYTKDLMKKLGVSRNTVSNLRKSGRLPEPHFDSTNHPYWTESQLRETETTCRFPL